MVPILTIVYQEFKELLMIKQSKRVMGLDDKKAIE